MCWPRLAWIMGVDWSDANLAGSLIGQKLAINEFVAYLISRPICKRAARWMSRPLPLSRSPSVGLQTLVLSVLSVGAFSAISPKRAPEIAQLGLRALAAATLSNLMERDHLPGSLLV
ncbi:putative nucleoside transporter [Escherichia coli]|uniref:Putative nucleoside transporter n=1 Tax=Escherichia coli TaxID=562 RepID=A0A484X2B1_ECOLX|nr:putative nucleoside transporter [Escherichia coli]